MAQHETALYTRPSATITRVVEEGLDRFQIKGLRFKKETSDRRKEGVEKSEERTE